MEFKDWIEKNRNWQIELGKKLGNKSGGITTNQKQTTFIDKTERVIKKCDMPIVGQSLVCDDCKQPIKNEEVTLCCSDCMQAYLDEK